jgi:hypothetical protein
MRSEKRLQGCGLFFRPFVGGFSAYGKKGVPVH